jgi:2-polyprenyl-3-methyl-5-hydroxy-6-metoxy-1,4-benzoquinol methylase
MFMMLDYIFKNIKKCNMCGSATSKHILLGQRLDKRQGINPKNKTGISVSVMKCNICGLVYNQPMPIPGNIWNHYDIDINDYWDNPSQLYSKDYFCSQLNTFKQLYGNVHLKKMKALDVGSGLGQTVVALDRAGFEALGIEPSPSFYDKALQYSRLSAESFINVSLEEHTLPDKEYDLITCPNVIEHLSDPGGSILKCLDSLKKGGLLYICVPSSRWVKTAMINLFYKVTASGYVTNTSPMHPPFHLYEFTKKSFIQHAKQNDYRIEIIEIKPDPLVRIPVVKKVFEVLTNFLDNGLQMDIWIRKVD